MTTVIKVCSGEVFTLVRIQYSLRQYISIFFIRYYCLRQQVHNLISPLTQTDQMSRPTRDPQSPDSIQIFCLQCDNNISKVTVTEVRLCPHCSSPTFVNTVERLGVTDFPSPPSKTSHCPDRKRGIDMHDANCDRRLRLCGVAGCPFATANSHD